MRDVVTKRTTLAHIDAKSESYFKPFYNYTYSPENTEVYIVGGDNSSVSKSNMNELLMKLKENHLEIKFAHIMENKGNSFAIDSITGDIYLDNDIDLVNELPLVFNVNKRKASLYSYSLFLPSPLKKVNIT
jgi:hypothetical protein